MSDRYRRKIFSCARLVDARALLHYELGGRQWRSHAGWARVPGRYRVKWSWARVPVMAKRLNRRRTN